MTSEDQSDLIAFLARPESYGRCVTAVERIDTHCAVVFLAGEHAYKLKRAVKFPFLDFSTVGRRRAACETEVTVNRRTAPDIYLGFVPLTRGSGGRLTIGGDGESIDWLVKMRRFDQDELFDHLANQNALTPALILGLADEIAAFHKAAEQRPEHGGRDGIAWVVASNDESFAPFLSGVFEAARVARPRGERGGHHSAWRATRAPPSIGPGPPLSRRFASAQYLPDRRPAHLVRCHRIQRSSRLYRRPVRFRLPIDGPGASRFQTVGQSGIQPLSRPYR
jgi:hypothetical protein